MKNDIGSSFEKFVDSTFENIDGILVKKGVCLNTGRRGYMWGEEFFESKEAVRLAMKGIYAQISLSIVNPNGETKKLGPEYTDKYFNGESGYDAYRNDLTNIQKK